MPEVGDLPPTVAHSRRARESARDTPPRGLEDPSIPMVLPPRKVFPIQVGDKLFQLSGASISSDGECSPKPGSYRAFD